MRVSKRGRAELALLGVTAIWGTSFVVVKGLLADISPLLFLAMRFTLATLVLGVIYRRKMQLDALRAGLLAGGLLFAGFVLQTESLTLTTPSKSAFLTGLSVPMIPFLNSLVYGLGNSGLRPKKYEVVGILVASLGMVLMTLPPGRFAMSAGDFLSLLCAIVFALNFIVISHFSPITSFETLTVVQIAFAAVLASMSAWAFGPIRFHATPTLCIAILAMGLLPTALAFTVLAWAQPYTTPTRLAVILALEPAVAWFTSYLITGEVLSARGKIGAGLILAGVLLVEFKRSKPETLNI
jgi:drug/metabolite transporter (DMT)-like permease